jgi:PTS system nitrogen regulatory IIA component
VSTDFSPVREAGRPEPGTREEVPATDSSQFAEWLQPREIILDLRGRDVEDVLRAAAHAIERTHGLPSTSTFDALWRREQAGSTALGEGLAIPHARIAGIARPLTLYLRNRSPVPFAASDGAPVSDLLVILVPSHGSPNDHLQLLAWVARLFSDRRFRKQLAHASDDESVARAFRAGIKRVIVI